MPKGDVTGRRFLIIRDNPSTSAELTFTPENSGCCFALPALAEIGSKTSDLFNDYHCPLFFWGNGFASADLTLQKLVNGTWADSLLITGDTIGIFYEFNFFVDRFGNAATGVKIDWNLVLNSYGEGSYRLKSSGIPIFGAATVDKYSFEFCLKRYTVDRANKTVVFTWYNNGTLGDPENDKLKKDFGVLNWFNQIRLPMAYFGNDSSPTWEREFVKYQTGKQVWTKDSQIEEYNLILSQYPYALHRYIKLDILQADDILVTDYNIQNPAKHINRQVIMNGGYEPKWEAGVQLSSVELKFQQAYQNFNHKRS